MTIEDITGYNLSLFNEVADAIEQNPEQHDQSEWGVRTGCGTAYCIAGWAAVVSNADITWRERQQFSGAKFMTLVAVDNEVPWVWARNALGISPIDAENLFDGSLGTTDQCVDILRKISVGTSVRDAVAAVRGDDFEWDDVDPDDPFTT